MMVMMVVDMVLVRMMIMLVIKVLRMMLVVMMLAVVMVVIFKTGAGRIVISYCLALAAQNSMDTVMMILMRMILTEVR